MQQAFRHWRKSISEPISLAVILLAVLLCVISGPFGSLQAFTAPLRLLYWVPVIVGGAAASLFIRIALRLWYPEVAKAWIETATVILFTGSFGIVLLLWSAFFTNSVNAVGFLPSNTLQLLYLAIVSGSFLWMRTFFISVISNKAVTTAEPIPEPPVEVKSEPRLMRRLPAGERNQVLYLSAEGHFVNVHTDYGTTALRMRFKDAIDEMEGVEGYYSHRSHWVNRDAITSATKLNASWRLKLSNGDEVPVSRKFQPDLEAVGLLQPLAAD